MSIFRYHRIIVYFYMRLMIILLFLFYGCGPAFNYEEIGIASYYSDFLEGRPTASGETFHQDSLTAAHKTLPLGLRIKVENLRNGKTIWVRVNDRGPFIKNRILDLSRRAADSLGLIQRGVDTVRILTNIPAE